MKTAIIGVVLAGLLALAMLSRSYDLSVNPTKTGESLTPSDVVLLCDTNFAAQVKQGVVLVDFFATWCGPCRRQAPIVEQVAKQLKGTAVVGKLDVDAAPATAQRFSIEGIPALIVFRNGNPVKQFVGVTDAETLIAAVTDALVDQPKN